MSKFDYEDVLAVDNIFRNTYDYYPFDREIEKISVEQIAMYKNMGEDSVYIYALLTMHGNGFVRELALKKLESYDSGIKMNFVILRVNDWVENIRANAKRIFIKMLNDEKYTVNLLDSLPLIKRMERWSRSDYTFLIESVNNRIMAFGESSLLIDRFMSTKNVYGKRLIFGYLLKNTECLRANIIMGLNTKDPIIIRMCLNAIDENHDKIELDDMLEMLKSHRLAVCRAFSIKFSSDHNFEDNESYLREMIYDKSYMVRDIARFYLKELVPVNYTQLYSEKISKVDNNLYGALSGLIEVGDASCFEFVKAYLSHGSTKVRKAAMNGLVKFDIDKAIGPMMIMLQSNDEFDSRNARKALCEGKCYLSFEELKACYMNTGYSHVKENILLLSRYLPKWNSLELILFIQANSVSDEQVLVNKLLKLWLLSFNRSYTKPSETQLVRLRNLLSGLSLVIKKDTFFEVNSILGSL